jgi:hypothetical protein
VVSPPLKGGNPNLGVTSWQGEGRWVVKMLDHLWYLGLELELPVRHMNPKELIGFDQATYEREKQRRFLPAVVRTNERHRLTTEVFDKQVGLDIFTFLLKEAGKTTVCSLVTPKCDNLELPQLIPINGHSSPEP